jgi:hypothetical protein
MGSFWEYRATAPLLPLIIGILTLPRCGAGASGADMKLRVAALLSVGFCANAVAAPAEYAVDELALGTHLSSNSASYREYKCSPSQQFPGLTWCQKTRTVREGRKDYNASYSLLHSQDGNLLYINRAQELGVPSSSKAEQEIQRYSRKIGEAPQIIRMPRRNAGPDGIIAVWGKVSLEPLDQGSVKILAEGKSPKKGLLIDFLANFARSAKQGLPIYRIDGGPGFVWAASFDSKGHGTSRLAAVDASALVSPSAEQPQQASEPAADAAVTSELKVSDASSTIETIRSQPADARAIRLDFNKPEPARELPPVETAPRVDNQIVARVDEAPDAAETADHDAVIQNAAADRRSSWRENAAYWAISGLLVVLAAFVVVSFKNRRREGGQKAPGIEPKLIESPPAQAQNSTEAIAAQALSPEAALAKIDAIRRSLLREISPAPNLLDREIAAVGA